MPVPARIFSLFLIAFVICCSAYGQNQTELKSLQKQYEASVRANKQRDAARLSYEIAKLYQDKSDDSKAIDYFEKSLSHAKKVGDNGAAYVALQSLGAVYVTEVNYTKALHYFEESHKVAQKMNNPSLEVEGLIYVAYCYGNSNRYKKALDPLDQALVLAINTRDIKQQMRCYSLLSNYHKALGNQNKSIEYASQYDLLVQQTKLKGRVSEAEQKQRETESQLKHTEQSLKEVEELNRTRQMEIDILSKDMELLHKENELLAKQKELLDQEKKLLSKEKELAEVKVLEQNARIRNEMIVRNAIIAGLLLVGILVAVLIIDYRKKIAANKKIKQQHDMITSSITYAKRIQEAMLPKHENKLYFQENSFVLFKPRDLVSGDFYWFNPIRNGHDDPARSDLAFAAVDCTGHGVPGAFMSMIGMNSLNGIMGRGVTTSNEILEQLHNEIRTALQQEKTGNNDGMDLALCIYRKQENLLEFSGAKGRLVYVQDNKVFHVKGDVHPIGGSKTRQNIQYKKHEIAIDKPTMVYLFSDGYQDQFGGNGKGNGKFMSKRFYQLLHDVHQLPVEEQKQVLEKTIEDWKGSGKQTDDILVVGIRIAPN